MSQNAWDGTAIRLMERPCDSCPFSSERKIDFVADVAKLARDCKETGKPNICHASALQMHHVKGGPAVCRGWYDSFTDVPLRKAMAKGMFPIKTVEIPRGNA